MCSFLILPLKIYRKIQNNMKKILKFLKKRGPDGTNIIEFNDYVFIHNILYFSGDITYQPLIDKELGIVLCFNGEIYNYKDFGNYKSDTEMLFEEYKKNKTNDLNFIEKLDGEFTFVIFDFNKNIIFQSSDIFATKPQWYNITDDGIIISSLRSVVCKCSGLEDEFSERNLEFPNSPDIIKHKSIKKTSPNKILKRDLKSFEIIDEKEVFKFNLNQHKSSYDDWTKAFENAIKKRTKNNNTQENDIGLCLSSGYDSGAISCYLNKSDIDYVSYSMKCLENIEILHKRMNLNKNKYYYDLTEETYNQFKEFYQKSIEGTCIPLYSNSKTITSYYNLIGDWAGIGLFFIFTQAKKDKIKIFLSGQGADEIFSDYGWKGRYIKTLHSNTINPTIPCSFYGDFPDDLEEIFPWPNFYHSQNEAFIAKEEHVATIFGIETRYPFFDKYVVQEFLWLSKELKNKDYKSPLFNYLQSNNYPFEPNEKMGFKAKITK